MWFEGKLTIKEYLEWTNECLNSNYTSIMELGGGQAYCRFVDLMFPGIIDMENVLMEPKLSETGSRNNLHLLQTALKNQGVDCKMDISKLSRSDEEANLKFMQWFYSQFYYRINASILLKLSKEMDDIKRMESKEAEKALNDEALEQRVMEEILNSFKKKGTASIALKKEQDKLEKEADVAAKAATMAVDGLKDVLNNMLASDLKRASKARKSKLPEAGGSSPDLRTSQAKKNTSMDDGSLVVLRQIIETLQENKETQEPLLGAFEKILEKWCYASDIIERFATKREEVAQVEAEVNKKYKENQDAADKHTERLTKAKRVSEYKASKADTASTAVKTAKYALAIMDVFQNTEAAARPRLQKDALEALKTTKSMLDDITSRKM